MPAMTMAARPTVGITTMTPVTAMITAPVTMITMVVVGMAPPVMAVVSRPYADDYARGRVIDHGWRGRVHRRRRRHRVNGRRSLIYWWRVSHRRWADHNRRYREGKAEPEAKVNSCLGGGDRSEQDRA
jgi:hypothetical protein